MVYYSKSKFQIKSSKRQRHIRTGSKRVLVFCSTGAWTHLEPLCQLYFCVWRFFWDKVLQNYLPGLALNLNPPDLCLLSSWYYRCEPSLPDSKSVVSKAYSCPSQWSYREHWLLQVTQMEICQQETLTSQAAVAHSCNPSYSGDRDQEDHGSKPAPANSLWDPIWKKNPSQKRAGTMA
jgi:hypothetical protein